MYSSDQCSGEVGGPVITNLPYNSTLEVHLILNATFQCNGTVKGNRTQRFVIFQCCSTQGGLFFCFMNRIVICPIVLWSSVRNSNVSEENYQWSVRALDRDCAIIFWEYGVQYSFTILPESCPQQSVAVYSQWFSCLSQWYALPKPVLELNVHLISEAQHVYTVWNTMWKWSAKCWKITLIFHLCLFQIVFTN